MKSVKTTAARGSAIALEVLSSMREDELDRIMDLGLPSSVFSALEELSPPTTPRLAPRFNCDLSVASLGISGLRPRIFLSSELSDAESATAVAVALFEMSRSIYLGELKGADRSDLDVWIGSGLEAELRLVSPAFIAAYGDDRSMLKIESNGSAAALGSFGALKKLVLTDG